MIGLLRTFFRRRQPVLPPIEVEIDTTSVAAAVAADRARCSAITGLPEAIGHAQLASALAHQSDVAVDVARLLLRAAASDRPPIPAEMRALCGRELAENDPDLAPAQAAARNEARPHR